MAKIGHRTRPLIVVAAVFALLFLCFVLAIALSRNWLSLEAALVIFAAALLFIYIRARDSAFAADLNSLKQHSVSLRDYEADIERRFAEVGQTLSSLEKQAGESDGNLVDQLTQQVAMLESRVKGLEGREQSAQAVPIQIVQDEEPDRPPLKPVEPQNPPPQLPVTEDMLSMHLQPVVELPSRNPIFFDAFMRLKRDKGDFLDESQFHQVISSGGLTPLIEKKVLMSSARLLKVLEGQKKKAGLICKFSGTTLADLTSFREVSSFLQSRSRLSQSIVLQLTQRDFSMLKPRQRDKLASLSELGFFIALDDVKDLNINSKQLIANGIRYLRVPTDILLHSELVSTTGQSSTGLIHRLSEEGLSVIACNVTREVEAVSLIDLNVNYASGHLFAPPRPVKSELLEASAAA